MAEPVMPEPKIIFVKVQESASTAHIDHGMNELNRTVTTAHLDNKMKAISQPTTSGSSPATGTGQSSNIQRK
jgi:isopentenyl phosphate kinase